MYKKLISRPWDRDGPKTKEANETLMKFLASSVKPFSLVENNEFRAFCQLLQPNYEVPKRRHFSQLELPRLYNQNKVRFKFFKMIIFKL